MQIFYLGADVQVQFFPNASLSQLLLSNVHRPKLIGYEALSFKNSKHVDVFTVVNIFFAFGHSYGTYCIQKGIRAYELTQAKVAENLKA